MNKITRKACGDLANEAIEALKKHFGDRFDIKRARARYSDQSLEFKATLSLVSESGVPGDWARDCWRVNLEEEDYGREFMSKGTRYKLVDINLKAHKYPLIGEALTGDKQGQRYKFTRDVKRLLAPRIVQ